MDPYSTEPKQQYDAPTSPRNGTLPVYQGQKMTKGVRPEGESGRKGVNPLKLLKISFRSSCEISKYVNILWPFVPAAFALVCCLQREEF